MIDLKVEKPLTFAEAALTMPLRNGSPTNVVTLYRWAGPGLRGVVLDSVQAGGRKITTHEALIRFFDRLAEVEAPPRGRRPRVTREVDALGA